VRERREENKSIREERRVRIQGNEWKRGKGGIGARKCERKRKKVYDNELTFVYRYILL
jgi:hypothetical protein